MTLITRVPSGNFPPKRVMMAEAATYLATRPCRLRPRPGGSGSTRVSPRSHLQLTIILAIGRFQSQSPRHRRELVAGADPLRAETGFEDSPDRRHEGTIRR